MTTVDDLVSPELAVGDPKALYPSARETDHIQEDLHIPKHFSPKSFGYKIAVTSSDDDEYYEDETEKVKSRTQKESTAKVNRLEDETAPTSAIEQRLLETSTRALSLKEDFFKEAPLEEERFKIKESKDMIHDSEAKKEMLKSDDNFEEDIHGKMDELPQNEEMSRGSRESEVEENEPLNDSDLKADDLDSLNDPFGNYGENLGETDANYKSRNIKSFSEDVNFKQKILENKHFLARGEGRVEKNGAKLRVKRNLPDLFGMSNENDYMEDKVYDYPNFQESSFSDVK